ncbi:hypothetical protein BDC45DRAFT_541557 [Circinella umbellata]|nr:hypothetical protein BDC45DRAFT_541557 [Circinella umbellata]
MMDRADGHNIPILKILINCIDKLSKTEKHCIIKETELITNYLDLVLSPIFHDPDNNRLFRCGIQLTSGRNSNSIPPVLVEIQYTGDMPLSSFDTIWTFMPSVVLAIVIHNTTANLTEMATVSEKKPFLFNLPCHGWAKYCYLLNASSISSHLQDSRLNPLVALGYFLIQQKLSLRYIERSDDETIHLLYAIAQELFGDKSKENKEPIMLENLKEIYDECAKAKSYLLEDVSDPTPRNRTLYCLDSMLLKINQLGNSPTKSIPPNTNVNDLNDNGRPDGGMNVINQLQSVYALGFVEVKAIDASKNYTLTHTDTLRLALFCKAALDKDDIKCAIAVRAVGTHVTFFYAQLNMKLFIHLLNLDGWIFPLLLKTFRTYYRNLTRALESYTLTTHFVSREEETKVYDQLSNQACPHLNLLIRCILT